MITVSVLKKTLELTWIGTKINKILLLSAIVFANLGSIQSCLATTINSLNDPIIVAEKINSIFLPSYYTPYIETSGSKFFGTKSNIKGAINVDIFLPIWQIENTLIFVDARGVRQTSSVYEGNLHLGYRRLNPESQKIIGIYGAFDKRKTEYGNYYNQLMLGGELWHNQWFLGANLYYPVGITKKRVERNTQIIDQPERGSFRSVWYNATYEKAMPGLDAEIGYELKDGLIAYAGGYYFKTKDIEAVTGPQFRMEKHFYAKAGPRFLKVFDAIAFEAGIKYDKPRGKKITLGIKIRLGPPFQNAPKLTAFERHMMDPVRRDIDVVTIPKQAKKDFLGEYIIISNDDNEDNDLEDEIAGVVQYLKEHNDQYSTAAETPLYLYVKNYIPALFKTKKTPTNLKNDIAYLKSRKIKPILITENNLEFKHDNQILTINLSDQYPGHNYINKQLAHKLAECLELRGFTEENGYTQELEEIAISRWLKEKKLIPNETNRKKAQEEISHEYIEDLGKKLNGKNLDEARITLQEPGTYRKIFYDHSLKWHPDKHQHEPKNQRDKATKKFLSVNHTHYLFYSQLKAKDDDTENIFTSENSGDYSKENQDPQPQRFKLMPIQKSKNLQLEKYQPASLQTNINPQPEKFHPALLQTNSNIPYEYQPAQLKVSNNLQPQKYQPGKLATFTNFQPQTFHPEFLQTSKIHFPKYQFTPIVTGNDLQLQKYQPVQLAAHTNLQSFQSNLLQTNKNIISTYQGTTLRTGNALPLQPFLSDTTRIGDVIKPVNFQPEAIQKSKKLQLLTFNPNSLKTNETIQLKQLQSTPTQPTNDKELLLTANLGKKAESETGSSQTALFESLYNQISLTIYNAKTYAGSAIYNVVTYLYYHPYQTIIEIAAIVGIAETIHHRNAIINWASPLPRPQAPQNEGGPPPISRGIDPQAQDTPDDRYHPNSYYAVSGGGTVPMVAIGSLRKQREQLAEYEQKQFEQALKEFEELREQRKKTASASSSSSSSSDSSSTSTLPSHLSYKLRQALWEFDQWRKERTRHLSTTTVETPLASSSSSSGANAKTEDNPGATEEKKDMEVSTGTARPWRDMHASSEATKTSSEAGASADASKSSQPGSTTTPGSLTSPGTTPSGTLTPAGAPPLDALTPSSSTAKQKELLAAALAAPSAATPIAAQEQKSTTTVVTEEHTTAAPEPIVVVPAPQRVAATPVPHAETLAATLEPLAATAPIQQEEIPAAAPVIPPQITGIRVPPLNLPAEKDQKNDEENEQDQIAPLVLERPIPAASPANSIRAASPADSTRTISRSASRTSQRSTPRLTPQLEQKKIENEERRQALVDAIKKEEEHQQEILKQKKEEKKQERDNRKMEREMKDSETRKRRLQTDLEEVEKRKREIEKDEQRQKDAEQKRLKSLQEKSQQAQKSARPKDGSAKK